MPSTRDMFKRSKETEQKQKHVNVTEIILIMFYIGKSYMLQEWSKFRLEAVTQASQRRRMEFPTYVNDEVFNRSSR